MIFRPSSVSVTASPTAAGGSTATGTAGFSATGAGAVGIARMREMGGRKVRFTASSETARFGFGTCSSIRETVSITGFGTGGGSATAGGAFGGAFLAVIGAKADFVAGTVFGDAVIAGLALATALDAATSSFGAFKLLAPGLTAVRERIDDLAEVADFAAFVADALGAVVLVVVFVAIQFCKNFAHGRERLGAAVVMEKLFHDAPLRKSRALSLHRRREYRPNLTFQRRASLRDW